MNSGIYGAVSGSLGSVNKLDVLANNLANVNTPGYKKDRIRFESVLAAAGNQMSADGITDAPVLVEERYAVDFTAGEMKHTGNTFDLALDGDGFFTVKTPEGTAYTRQGNFRIDANGMLVTADGYQVLSGGSPIVINGSSVAFDPQGKIFVEGVESGTIDVVDFPKPYDLRKIGSALFLPNSQAAVPQPARETKIVQGQLEGSNVNAIEEMVRLIEATRSSESCQRLIQNYDTIIGKAVNELGKV